MAIQQAARKLKRVKKVHPQDQVDSAGEGSPHESADVRALICLPNSILHLTISTQLSHNPLQDSDSEYKSGNSADDPESAYMNKLFALHPMNMDYDALEPVVINPADPDRFFLLTHTKCRTWAQMRVRVLFILTISFDCNQPYDYLTIKCL